MRSLTQKLLIAFLAVSLAGTLVTALYASRQTADEFSRYASEQRLTSLITGLAYFYQLNGGWADVAESDLVSEPGSVQSVGKPVQTPTTLVGDSGKVVIAGAGYVLGQQVSTEEIAQGFPIEVGGQVVGTLLAAPDTSVMRPLETAFLSRVNQALMVGAVGASLVALVLGILLARTLARPIRELTHATRAVAKGNLAQQVPVHSQDELGELTMAFNQMSIDLAQAQELRRQMTADIAHELRTPLSIISGYIESFRDGLLPATSETFDIVYDEVRHLSRLVQDLRTLSLAEARELSLSLHPIAPQDLLENAATTFARDALERNISMQVKISPELSEIDVDRDRMAQVLGNLVSNALRYTPDGGLIVLGATAPSDNELQFTVSDNGAGIAPEDLPHVFDRFYRGDSSRQIADGESGLGLAIAKSIVEMHGGTISVNSDLGEGTTFIISISANIESAPEIKDIQR
jgi:two-component system sensor histidine kinase BaeS